METDQNSISSQKVKKVFIFLVPILWAIALFLPAYIFPAGDGSSAKESMLGIWCFVFGWFALFTNPLAFLAWLANIPFWKTYFEFVSGAPIKKGMVVFAAAALLLSLSALAITELANNEGGVSNSAYPSIGAFVWIASMLTLLVGLLVVKRSQGQIKKIIIKT
jgi:hypothetical protein